MAGLVKVRDRQAENTDFVGVAATTLPPKMTIHVFSAKPQIASADEPSEIADIITKNDCGQVVSPEREQELASCMEKSVDAGKECLKRLGANSLIYTAKNLSKSRRGVVKMLKRIYLSPLGYVISFIQNLFSIFHRPFMVYGFYNQTQKKFMRQTRISSSTKVVSKKKLDLSDGVWIGHYSVLDASHGIKFGKGVQTGSHISIYTHSSHNSIRLLGDSYLSTNDRVGYITGDVLVGEFSFIGDSAVIFPGVEIGKGCLVKAGSVVTNSVPDFSVVSGNPAQVIGSVLATDEKFLIKASVRETYFDQDVVKSKRWEK